MSICGQLYAIYVSGHQTELRLNFTCGFFQTFYHKFAGVICNVAKTLSIKIEDHPIRVNGNTLIN